MATVYNSSACNFIVSAVTYPTKGYFNPLSLKIVPIVIPHWRTTTASSPLSVIIKTVELKYKELISGPEAGPLAQRGWVGEERHHTKIDVYFAPRCLFWECLLAQSFKDYPNQNLFYEGRFEARSHWIFHPWLALSARNLEIISELKFTSTR